VHGQQKPVIDALRYGLYRRRFAVLRIADIHARQIDAIDPHIERRVIANRGRKSEPNNIEISLRRFRLGAVEPWVIFQEWCRHSLPRDAHDSMMAMISAVAAGECKPFHRSERQRRFVAIFG
jgi:hypothetical protein